MLFLFFTRMKKYIPFLILISVMSSYSYESLLFRPLAANVFEPRIGVLFQPSYEKLRLDIGASFDLADKREVFEDKDEMRMGADFMTYTRLRSEGSLKFPVETSDYWFGFNFSYKPAAEDNYLSHRLRVAHISSHLVDGLAKDTVLSRTPFVFSREFVDYTAAYNFGDCRVYAGLNYIFSTKPKEVKALEINAGADGMYPLADKWKIQAGYHFRLTGAEKYSGQHAGQAGLLFESSKGRGIMLSAYYFSGMDIHGMFFRERTEYVGLGFQVFFI